MLVGRSLTLLTDLGGDRAPCDADLRRPLDAGVLAPDALVELTQDLRIPWLLSRVREPELADHLRQRGIRIRGM